MSDVSEGPGWWLASDGKWYPPHVPPGYPDPPARADASTASSPEPDPDKVPASALTVVLSGVALAPIDDGQVEGPDRYRVTFQRGDRRFVIEEARGAVLQFAKLIGTTVRCVGEPGGGRPVVLLDPDGDQQCTGASYDDTTDGSTLPTVGPALDDRTGTEDPPTSVVQPRPRSGPPGTVETVAPTDPGARALDDTGIHRIVVDPTATRVVRPVPVSPLETGEIPAYVAPVASNGRRRRRFPYGIVIVVLVALAAIAGVTYVVRKGTSTAPTTTTSGPLRTGVVPVAVGQPWLSAVNEVKQVGLTVSVQRGSSAAPVGVVYHQSPAAGTHAAAGSTVVLSISTGPSG